MKFFFMSLGCDKNLVDSEMMVLALQKAGHELIDDEALAEVIVVNTCCFIGDAKEESINALLAMAEYKETGACRVLAAAGCLAQRYHREIKEEIPEVDVIVGTTGYEGLVSAIESALMGKGVQEWIKGIDYLPEPFTDRNSLSGGYYAYLKIAEGCNKNCSYCIIPKVRGRYRSVPIENLMEQAGHLVRNGAKELILVAQETTLYGTDLYGTRSLGKLLASLSEIEGICWIRLMYCYPEEITEDLVQTIKKLPKVCHYLDIPIQHASDAVLKRMGRRTDRHALTEKIHMLRREIPDIVLRTTLITGFPGETDEDFSELLAFVEAMRFDRLGVFTYSREEGTPAAEFSKQIEEKCKEKRRDEVMALQQGIVFEKNEALIGRKFDVMIEGELPEEGVYVGRTYMDAPEVDGFIFLKSEENLVSGDFVNVRILGADGYDLIGEINNV